MQSAELFQTDTPSDQEEAVFVLRTIGPVQDFLKRLVEKVPGTEALELSYAENIDDTVDYYDQLPGKGDNHGKKIESYFVAANEDAYKALKEIARLSKRLETLSSPIREAFMLLESIRLWNATDRLRALVEDQKAMEEADVTRIEIEIWFSKSAEKQQGREQYILNELRRQEIPIVTRTLLAEISYHALIVDFNKEQLRALLEQGKGTSIERASLPSIIANISAIQSFARPMHYSDAVPPEPEADAHDPASPYQEFVPDDFAPAELPPLVAVFDGLPLLTHERLSERVELLDPDDWNTDDKPEHRKHGTSMCSLAIWGDMGRHEHPKFAANS